MKSNIYNKVVKVAFKGDAASIYVLTGTDEAGKPLDKSLELDLSHKLTSYGDNNNVEAGRELVFEAKNMYDFIEFAKSLDDIEPINFNMQEVEPSYWLFENGMFLDDMLISPVELVTHDEIDKAFRSGAIKLDFDANGCDGLCCTIGSTSFYFVDGSNKYDSINHWYAKHSKEETIDCLYEILKNYNTSWDNGLSLAEVDSYVCDIRYANSKAMSN